MGRKKACRDEIDRRIIALVAEGFDSAQIGACLGYSGSRITTIRSEIMDALGARNACHMVAIAIREGLI